MPPLRCHALADHADRDADNRVAQKKRRYKIQKIQRNNDEI
jgi:hypothetical protein